MSFKKFLKERKRTLISIIIGFVILGYIVFTENLFLEAKVYGAMGLFSLFILWIFPKLWKKSKKKESIEEAYIGVNKKPVIGIFMGLFFAFIFIVLSQFKFFSGITQLITPKIVLASIGAVAFIVILVAPIFEETAYTTSFASVLNLYLPFWLVATLKGLLFSASHYYAYVILAGGTLSSSLGAFVGAGLFGFASAYIGKYYGSQASISAHFGFNAWNFINLYQVFTILP